MFSVIVKLAVKNAFLRRARAILLVLMIGLSMGVMLSIEGLYDGMAQDMIERSLRSDSGEVSMYAKGYRIERDIRYRIEQAKGIVNALNARPDVDCALSRLQADGLAQTAFKSYPARLIGIDPEAEEKFGKFNEFAKEGNVSLGSYGAAVGIELAKKLKLKPGAKLVFSTQDANHEIQSVALRVRAVVQTTNIAIDEQALFVDKARAAKLLAVSPQSATQIALRSQDAVLKSALQTRYPELEVYTFKELNPQLEQMKEMTDVFNAITFTIVMLVVFVGILGVMYVAILDRIREFGILLCIGYTYAQIRLQILLEALVLAFTGYLLGCLVGWSLLWYLSVYGLDLSAFADGLESFGMRSIMHAQTQAGYFINTFFAILGASVLSVWLPLRRIAKLNPVDVIKE